MLVKLKFIVFIAILLILLIVLRIIMSNSKILRIGYPAYWGSIIPPLQHTAYGDEIQLNQFEPLVTIGRNGQIEPLAALSWNINNNFTKFTFKIDNNRRFSDGTKLEARHFKEAWLHGLTLNSKSYNLSTSDVLYRIKGYKDFKKFNDIVGITVLDKETLVIEFSVPFRMALDHLSGGRFASYLLRNNKYIGTGPYVINELKDKNLKLTKNFFSNEKTSFDNVLINVVDVENAIDLINKNKLDVLMFAEKIKNYNQDIKNIDFLNAYEASHVAIDLNGLNNRFFSSKKNRKYMQSLILKIFEDENLTSEYSSSLFKFDPQIFLPVQKGRVDELKVKKYLENNLNIQYLVEQTKKTPLIFYTTGDTWIKEALIKYGINFSKSSRIISFTELMDEYYKNYTPDMILGNFSVVMGDPDGIHHVLGKDGAIASPINFREKVSQLIEEGRSLIQEEQLDEHYQKVSMKVLEEVPFVHLGYKYGKIIFSKSRIGIDEVGINRKEPKIQYFYSK